MPNIKQLAKTAVDLVQKNSPYILTGLGCAGVVSTAVMTGRAAVKADEAFNSNAALEYEMGSIDTYEDLTWKDRIKWTWRYFVPPAISGAASIACIIGAQTVNSQRHAAIAGLYTLTEQTLKEYQDKVVEQIGANKAQKIRDEVDQEMLNKNPVSQNTVLITGKGDTLCYDTLSGRYFKSDIETLRRIQNDLNHELMGSMWVPLNDVYFAMGIPQIKIGNELGWTTDELLEFKFSSKIADDGTPCIVLDFGAEPRTQPRW